MNDSTELQNLDEALEYLNNKIKDRKKYTEAEKELKEKGSKVFNSMQYKAQSDGGINIKFKFIYPDSNRKTVKAFIGAIGTMATAAYAGLKIATLNPGDAIDAYSGANKDDIAVGKEFREFAKSEKLFDKMKEKYDFVKDIRFTGLQVITVYIK